MATTAYTGLPGGGKSYGVVENVIIPALKQQRKVYTNIPMNREVCIKRLGSSPIQFDTQDIIDNPDWWSDVFEPGSIIVIDELWRLWPSGLKSNNIRQQDKEFIAEHRHLVGENGFSTEVVFITQDLSDIASFFRNKVATTYRVVKLSSLGFEERFRVDVYQGVVTGPSPPLSKREREIHGKFKKEIYELYKSHTKSVTGAVGNEARVDKRFNALGKLSIKLGIVLVLVALVGFYYGFKYMTSYYSQSSEEVQPVISQQSNLSPATISESVKPKEIFRFLSKSEGIWITGHFKTRYSDGRVKEEYIFEILFDESIVHLNQLELGRLGYEVNHVNDCMVILKGDDFNGYALCQRQELKKGWVENMVTSPSSDPT